MENAIKKSVSIEELLVGMSLLTFFQELVAIKDEELVDKLPPIKEGEIPLGDMTPFDKRLSHWFDLKASEIVAWGEEMQESICVTCKVCGTADAEMAPCADMFKLGDYVSERFHSFISESVSERFPRAKGDIALRQGFKIVTNVREKPENHFVCIGNFEDIAELLGPLSMQMSGKKPH
ncbi:hypothetical protein A2524_01750 [Candidatus Wolfebacteria bacterium RIFOXYD12_FULL_48_21]|uniref:Uncharacterized protein n=1 Tax=Candidatus Wolfebacteria bacterium RIFOXYD1_FULL_48_65 TaxID=1802561 RepID=A0A1F8E1A4_9BACT|nr:MAG: hypothetical protein A2610_03725 [Candidatus Wolfebacteria bacterium RIFOXYD1_FULL_48_65]OGM94523.1 MAG: hypothetical protein A2524_01750 [Candidatus Wolfebacteria bacterium RIFOXYD12_FULL_48_21]OGM96189.1 MAG: hypothetical protein A2532_01015 [Candidatus Wolfebacteria bacterium RIFOXYD2_FULL_48_11]